MSPGNNGNDPSKSPKILIVDDDEMIRLLYKEYFATAGVKVYIAEDGIVAKGIITDINPHLIICDVMMPKFSGIDLLRWVKENEETSDIPMIMITADGRNITRREAMESGAADFLIKPLPMKYFLERVSTHLQQAWPAHF